MKLSDLKPNDRNPRKITDEKLQALKKALGEFGDLSGIIFNKTTGRLVGGHQRLKVLPPDIDITMDSDTSGYFNLGDDRFHVRIVEWDEKKEAAALLCANTNAGEWDLPQLKEILHDLDSCNIDLELTGFDDKELQKLMAPITPPKEKDEVIPRVIPKTCPSCGYLLE